MSGGGEPESMGAEASAEAGAGGEFLAKDHPGQADGQEGARTICGGNAEGFI